MILKNFKAKDYFTLLVSILLLIDLVILLNIPFLRQILGFLCFTIIPGLLILHILKLNKIEFFKKFVLSIGLSIAFLFFAGLFLNQLYLNVGIIKPLSTFLLITSFTFILIILAFIAYIRNKDDFDINDVFNVKVDLKDKLTSFLIFPFLFPFISIFGVFLMNATGNNTILLIIPFLIVFYVAFIVYHDNRSEIIYPIAITMIGLSLVLMLPLRGEHLIAGDGCTEYGYMLRVIKNAYWDIELSRGHSVNACLSIVLLQPILHFLTGLTPEFTYRLVSPLLLSVTPLVLFIMFKKYTKDSYAFLAALFFTAQFSYIYCINCVRMLVSIVFFVLLLMSIFDREMDAFSRKLIVIIFMISLVLSYYTYCYLFSYLILSYLLISLIVTNKIHDVKENVTFTLVLICFIMIFLWWSQITGGNFNNAVRFIHCTVNSLNHAFLTESNDILAQKAIGRGLQGIPEVLNFITYYITLGLIVIGSIGLILRRKTSNFDFGYIFMIVSCLTLWAIMVVSPYISEDFGIDRVYLFTVPILAPCVVAGAQVICRLLSPETWRYIKTVLKADTKLMECKWYGRDRHKFVVLLTLIVIISNFFVSTGITNQMFGDSHSVLLNSKGMQHDLWYTHNQEITAGTWIIKNKDPSGERIFDPRLENVHGDIYVGNRFALVPNPNNVKVFGTFFNNNKSIGRDRAFIFLRHQNVVEGTIYTWYPRRGGLTVPLTEYSHLFTENCKIYDNGGSEVYR